MSENLQLTDLIAVALLVATDALFLPDRDPLAYNRHRVICERRNAYAGGGVPWSSERVEAGLDDAGRKQVQRTLERLVAEGIAQTFRPKGAKTLGAKLTDEGDAHARGLAGLPTFADAGPVLEAMERHSAGPEATSFLGRLWVPETLLAGVAWGDNERRQAFVELEGHLLPATVRGLVDSNCSVHGHCWYALRPGWRKVLPSPVSESSVTSARNEVARREYFGRLRWELDALGAAQPENEREIGEIPMPVSSPRTSCGQVGHGTAR